MVDPQSGSAEEFDAPRGQTGPVLPPSRFAAGHTVGEPRHGPHSPDASAGPPAHALPGHAAAPAPPPADPHADYLRQAAQHFAAQPDPSPSPDDFSQAPPAGGNPVHDSAAAPAPWGTPGQPRPVPGSDQSLPGAGWNSPNAAYTQGQQWSGFQNQHASNVNTARLVLIAGGAVAILVSLLVIRWFLSLLFSGAGWVVVLLAAVAAAAYFWFRQQNPQQAGRLEAQTKQGVRVGIGRLTTMVKASTSNGTTHASNPPTGYAPLAADTPHSAPNSAAPPPAGLTGQPYFIPARHPGYGHTPASGASGTEAFKSALLLVPTLIAYAVLHNSSSLTSLWQPWWILNGINAYFVVCVAARARAVNRRAPAVLLAMLGTVLVGLATSPSAQWSLTALLSKKQSYGDVSYAEPPVELIPWIVRLPVIAALIFVAAWGVARRGNGSWVVGLVPAGLFVWLSIWYQEHQFTGGAGWFGYWLLTIGMFVAGCIVCWAVDALANPRTPISPPAPPSW
jgi:hypothetical protein